jgi:hypothetical protein
VAVVLAEFAERWDGRLEKLAGQMACQCQPARTSSDESEHDPHCPVGLLRQAGRLMCEEADEYGEAAKW